MICEIWTTERGKRRQWTSGSKSRSRREVQEPRISLGARHQVGTWTSYNHLRPIFELVISAFVAGWTAVTGTNANDRYPNILHRGHLSAVGRFDRQERLGGGECQSGASILEGRHSLTTGRRTILYAVR